MLRRRANQKLTMTSQNAQRSLLHVIDIYRYPNFNVPTQLSQDSKITSAVGRIQLSYPSTAVYTNTTYEQLECTPRTSCGLRKSASHYPPTPTNHLHQMQDVFAADVGELNVPHSVREADRHSLDRRSPFPSIQHRLYKREMNKAFTMPSHQIHNVVLTAMPHPTDARGPAGIWRV
jgi:hypothetical protein